MFADNYWIIATSPTELEEANDLWQSLLCEYSWHTDVSDMTYGTTAEYAHFLASVLFEGRAIRRTPRGEGFKVLGPFSPSTT